MSAASASAVLTRAFSSSLIFRAVLPVAPGSLKNVKGDGAFLSWWRTMVQRERRRGQYL